MQSQNISEWIGEIGYLILLKICGVFGVGFAFDVNSELEGEVGFWILFPLELLLELQGFPLFFFMCLFDLGLKTISLNC